MQFKKAETGLASRWGWVVIRGVMGIVFGLIAFSRPGAMAFSMVLVFGCYAFAAGSPLSSPRPGAARPVTAGARCCWKGWSASRSARWRCCGPRPRRWHSSG